MIIMIKFIDTKIMEKKFIKKFKLNSKFTEEDAFKLGRELNIRLSKRRKF